MELRKVDLCLEGFPEELKLILVDCEIFDSSCGSDAKVYYLDTGFFLKIAEAGKLKLEAEMIHRFHERGLGVEVVKYISNDRDFMLTKAAFGKDCTHYLEHPKELCETLAKAMRELHAQSIEDMPVSSVMEYYETRWGEGEKRLQYDTLIHGDYCLPNIILDQMKFSSYIDLALAGVGDRHVDIYWVLWSLSYNLKTDEYREYFLELYGRENIDEAILEMISKIENM